MDKLAAKTGSYKAMALLILLHSLLFLLVFGCIGHTTETDAGFRIDDSKIMKLSVQDNGKSITVHAGTVIELELSASGGTGYSWVVTKLDRELLGLITEEKTAHSANEKLVGAPVLYNWSFRAIRKGTTDLEIRLFRSWEGPARSAGTFKLGVRIDE